MCVKIHPCGHVFKLFIRCVLMVFPSAVGSSYSSPIIQLTELCNFPSEAQSVIIKKEIFQLPNVPGVFVHYLCVLQGLLFVRQVVDC